MKGLLIFASNTDCGKTLLSAGLVRAALSRQISCKYIKPVQTGVVSGPESDEADAMKIRKWTKLDRVETLVYFKDPVSPHLAAAKENRKVSSYEIRQKLAQSVIGSNGLTIIETAGGVLSPFPDEIPAADALQLSSTKMNLRTILVGDSRLGGISQTLAALEALESRRYDVCSLVLFSPDELEMSYGNEQYLKKRLIRNPPVRRILTPIPKGDEDIHPSFFENPVFDEILSDALDLDHDRRRI